jgi:hypothetical protein
MIKPDMIPNEVVEAAAKAMWRTDDPTAWEKMMAATAIFAALDAWPEGFTDTLEVRQTIILPLPQEARDD